MVSVLSCIACYWFLNVPTQFGKLLLTLFYRIGDEAREGKEFSEFTFSVKEWAMTLSLLFYSPQ